MRLRELYETINLFEAYDTKVAKLHKEFAQMREGFPEKPETQWGPAQPAIPGDPSVPDETQLAALVGFAEQAFKSGAKPSEQAMQWYLSLLETYYKQNDPKFAGKFAAMIGQYQFTDFNSLNNDLAHFFTSEYADSQYMKDLVKAIRPATTQVDNLITNATAAEQRIHAENEEARKLASRPDIELAEGDQVILPVDNKYDWWWLPHNSHEFESKAMGHCGRCQASDSNLLSLRTKRPIWPELTFEWNPENNILYQTKGPKNSKPAHRYRPAILKLMLSDLISGIGDDSYQPANDFSIFDFEPADVKKIADTKPVLIHDQIIKYPIDFLRAPEFIRGNPSFRNAAIENSSGLGVLVDESGKVNTSLDAWETAIEDDPSLIIYAPEELDDYENRIIHAISIHSSLLGFASAKIRSNYNIMSNIIQDTPEAIETVPLRASAYEKLAIQAVSKRSQLLKAVPEEQRTFEVCLAATKSRDRYALGSISDFYQLFNTLPFTKEQHTELASILISVDDSNELLELLPKNLIPFIAAQAQLRFAENNLWGDARTDKIKEIVANTDPNTMSRDEYLKLLIKVGNMTFQKAVPEEMQTYEYFEKYILTVEPTEYSLNSPFFTDAYKNLPPEQQEHLLSVAVKLCPEVYFKLPVELKLNLTTLLDVIEKTDKMLDRSTITDIVIASIETNVTKDQYNRILNYYRKSIEKFEGSGVIKDIIEFPLSKYEHYNRQDYFDLIEYIASLNLSDFIHGIEPEEVERNADWFVDVIVKNFSKADNSIFFSVLTKKYPEIAIDIYKRTPTRELSKLSTPSYISQMYKVDPIKFKKVVELMIDRDPELLIDVQELVPEHIPESEQPWVDSINYKGFSNGGIYALERFPIELLTPKLLSTALVNAGAAKISDALRTRLSKIYQHFKNDPEYKDVTEDIVNVCPHLIATLNPHDITLRRVQHFVKYLEDKQFLPHQVLLRCKVGFIPNAANRNPEIAEYLNKYKAENAPQVNVEF